MELELSSETRAVWDRQRAGTWANGAQWSWSACGGDSRQPCSQDSWLVVPEVAVPAREEASMPQATSVTLSWTACRFPMFQCSAAPFGLSSPSKSLAIPQAHCTLRAIVRHTQLSPVSECCPPVFGDYSPFGSQSRVLCSGPRCHGRSRTVAFLLYPLRAVFSCLRRVAFVAACCDGLCGPAFPTQLQAPGEQRVSPLQLGPSRAPLTEPASPDPSRCSGIGETEGRKLFSDTVPRLHKKAGPLPSDVCPARSSVLDHHREMNLRDSETRMERGHVTGHRPGLQPHVEGVLLSPVGRLQTDSL